METGIRCNRDGDGPSRPAAAGRLPQAIGRAGACVAAGALLLLLLGCVPGQQSVRFAVDPHSPQYMPSLIISAMESAGYRQVHFRSFRDDDEVVWAVTGSDVKEFHFERESDGAYVARVFFDSSRSKVTVYLDVKQESAAGEQAREELGRLDALLRHRLGAV